MAGGEVTLVALTKRFADVVAVDCRRPPRGRRRVLLAAGPLGLRQDDHAADGGRLRGADARARSCSTASTSPIGPPYKRNVNTVFQSYALFPHLRVFDNVAFGLRRSRRRQGTRSAAGSPMRWPRWS